MNWYLAVLKNYTGFSGRANRQEYWMFFLFNAIFATVLYVLGIAIGTEIPYYLYVLAVLLPGLAAASRRLHDTGRSAGWIFIALIPFIGGIILLVFLATAGNTGPNVYGPDPSQPSYN